EAGLDALVLTLEPGFEPEGLDADDLLLFVSHRARDVHHVDDDGVGDGLFFDLPRLVAEVVTRRDDDGVLGVVGAEGDLPSERRAVGPLEATQRVRADASDADVAVLLVDDGVLAAVLDVRQRELFAEDVGELLEGDVVLDEVIAWLRARLLFAFAGFVRRRERIPRLPVALGDTPLLALREAEAGDVDLRDGNGHDVLPLLAHQLPLRDVLPEVLTDLTSDDVSEAGV